MAGSSIFDYVHSQDHQELADQLGLGLAGISSTMSSPSSPTLDSPTTPRSITPTIPDRVPVMTPNLEKGIERTFCLRMKSTLTKRGVHTRSSGYRVVLFVGQFRHQMNFGLGRKGPPPLLGLAGAAIALPPPTITELRLEADTFIMRLTTEFKIIYCENMISNLTDWKCEELSGKDLYKFCHPGDLHNMRKIHTDLLMKGQVLSPSIRLLNKGGGYIWVQVCATSLYNSKTSDDQTILAIFQTISVEHRGVIMDVGQLDKSPETSNSPSTTQEPVTGPMLLTNEGTDHLMAASEQSTGPESNSKDDSPELQTEEESSLFPDSVENDFLLEDHSEDLVKLDTKVSRRKTERPRKRKRESSGECSAIENSELVLSNPENTDMDKTETDILNLSSNRTSNPNSPTNDRSLTMTSPQLPEDLSFRTIVDKDESQSCDSKQTHNLTNTSDLMSSSVKELEKVMNRHLPLRADSYHPTGSNGVRSMCDMQKPSIHWNGASSLATLADESLAASAFLRHLYTNRESVIRSNGRPNCFNGDVNALSMLTPPNTDICKDQLHLNIPHISVQSKSHFSVGKDVVSPADDFSMTPPSSVSPQDKIAASPFTEVDNECHSSRLAHGNQLHSSAIRVQNFPSLLENDSDVQKSHFPSVPSYSYNGADLNHFSHCSGPGGGSAGYDSRQQTGHGMWFSSTYTS